MKAVHIVSLCICKS